MRTVVPLFSSYATGRRSRVCGAVSTVIVMSWIGSFSAKWKRMRGSQNSTRPGRRGEVRETVRPGRRFMGIATLEIRGRTVTIRSTPAGTRGPRTGPNTELLPQTTGVINEAGRAGRPDALQSRPSVRRASFAATVGGGGG